MVVLILFMGFAIAAEDDAAEGVKQILESRRLSDPLKIRQQIQVRPQVLKLRTMSLPMRNLKQGQASLQIADYILSRIKF